MSIDRKLNEQELENFVGGPIKAADLPDKFKSVEKDPDEIDIEQAEKLYGGPIKAEDLPEGFYKSKDEIIRH